MRTQEKKRSKMDIIVDAIIADNLSTVPDTIKNNPSVYLNACLMRYPPIESLQQIVKTIYGHEKLTNEEIRNIGPTYILEDNIYYFTEGNNMLTFIKIFYPHDYPFTYKELDKIINSAINHNTKYEHPRGEKLLKLVRYYIAQLGKQLK